MYNWKCLECDKDLGNGFEGYPVGWDSAFIPVLLCVSCFKKHHPKKSIYHWIKFGYYFGIRKILAEEGKIVMDENEKSILKLLRKAM